MLAIRFINSEYTTDAVSWTIYWSTLLGRELDQNRLMIVQLFFPSCHPILDT